MSGPPSAYQQPPAAMSRPPSVISGEAAWVLIFNEGRQNEGVYTLQGLSGSAPASVLAFEHVEDADRFAHALHAEGGFDRPTALRWMAGQLATFCDDTGFALEFVPRGEMPIPPSKNEYDPDTMERRQGGDPERKYPGDGSGRGDPYIAYRLRLEALFPQRPIECADEEDCILPEKEETTALRHDLEGLYPQKPDNCADEEITPPAAGTTARRRRRFRRRNRTRHRNRHRSQRRRKASRITTLQAAATATTIPAAVEATTLPAPDTTARKRSHRRPHRSRSRRQRKAGLITLQPAATATTTPAADTTVTL